MKTFFCLAWLILGFTSGFLSADEAGKQPEVGQQAPEVTLSSLAGDQVSLSAKLKAGPVVLVVLRGYPGYQCPLCSRQVGELLGQAEALKGLNATVLLIYPGPAEQLQKRAQEFLGDKALPASFHMLLDPDYRFTNTYGLRWDAPRETAYPASFVISPSGTVKLAKVSKTHGDRAKTADLLDALSTAE